MKSWLESDVEALIIMVDEYCNNRKCSECPFYPRTVECLGDIARRLNRTLYQIEKCKKELSQYV